MGFKNARKATSYAAEAAAEKLATDARRLGFGQVQKAVTLSVSFSFVARPS